MSIFRERRRHPRAIIEWPVTIRTDQGIIDGVALNVSAGGATIRCQNLPDTVEVFELAIKIPRAERTVVVGAKVVWTNMDTLDQELTPPSIGVFFTDIADTQRWLISTAVMMALKKEERAPSRAEAARRLMEKALKKYEKETSQH